MSEEGAERWHNGLYVVAHGEATPVMTEGDDDDINLLREFLHERRFELKTQDLEAFVETVDYLTDCDECGIPLSHGEENERSHGTYCDHCVERRTNDE